MSYSWSPGRWDSSHYASWMKVICLFPGMGWCCWLTRPYVSGMRDRADPTGAGMVCIFYFVPLRLHPQHPTPEKCPPTVQCPIIRAPTDEQNNTCRRMCVGLVNKGRIRWAKSFGYAPSLSHIKSLITWKFCSSTKLRIAWIKVGVAIGLWLKI